MVSRTDDISTALSENHVVIDVRSPGEFAQGHIPGAHNIALFSDEERAQVGTAYTQVSQEEAIRIGYEFVNPKKESFIQQAKALLRKRQTPVDQTSTEQATQGPSEPGAASSLAAKPQIADLQTAGQDAAPQNPPSSSTSTLLLYCWRGGMRSAAVAELFSESGMDVTVIEGGYKTYRRYVLSLLEDRLPLVVIGGRTGSRKTDILRALKELGEQTLDLEAIANHRGSAFGALGQPPQPSSEMAMNLSAQEVQSYSKDRPIYVEDESLRIGSVVLHAPLHDYMQQVPIVVVDIPRDERAEYLARVYGEASSQELIDSFERIRKRLGGDRTQRAIDAVKRDDLVEAASIALEYYDPTYDYALSKRDQSLVHVVDCAGLADAEIAQRITVVARQLTLPGK